MTTPKPTDGTATPVAGPSAMLFRSHMEIERILKMLVRDRTLVAADVGDGETLYLTRLLHVDPDKEAMVIAYSEQATANELLLDSPRIAFRANHRRAHIEFECVNPSATRFKGTAAIRLGFPSALTWSQRREHPRIPVPPNLSLRCVADSSGVIPFEARIVDVSLGGMGGIIYDAPIKLEVGAVLRDCKIVIPGGDAILVDLEVRYTAPIAGPDGRAACRSGVRFLNRPKGIEALINLFVRDLDAGRK